MHSRKITLDNGINLQLEEHLRTSCKRTKKKKKINVLIYEQMKQESVDLGCCKARAKSDFWVNGKKLRKLEHTGRGKIQAVQQVPPGLARPILSNLAYGTMRWSGLCRESYIYQVSDQMSLPAYNNFWGRVFEIQAIWPKIGNNSSCFKEIYG